MTPTKTEMVIKCGGEGYTLDVSNVTFEDRVVLRNLLDMYKSINNEVAASMYRSFLSDTFDIAEIVVDMSIEEVKKAISRLRSVLDIVNIRDKAFRKMTMSRSNLSRLFAGDMSIITGTPDDVVVEDVNKQRHPTDDFVTFILSSEDWEKRCDHQTMGIVTVEDAFGISLGMDLI